jgi:hypothetical protein
MNPCDKLSSLSSLSIAEIVTALPNGTFSSTEKRSRRKLQEAILSLPSEYRAILSHLASSKPQRKASALQSNNLSIANPLFCRSVRTLSMEEIAKALPAHTFTPSQRRSRASMENTLVGVSSVHQETLFEVAAAKKRKRDDVIEDIVDCGMRKRFKETNDFPSNVSKECLQSRISKFIDATGTKALARSVCAVCAGSFFVSEVREVLVSHLQEKNLLRPFRNHPRHVLTSGMLLHRSPDALRMASDGVLWSNVCDSCTHILQRDKIPPLALANGTWIGDVPSELSILTLPERILVARFFPAAYIVKLYPQQKGRWSAEGMQSALRGNVSTYRLNTGDIVKMTDSQLMPPSSSILAATIGVTFVGPKNIPQWTMPGFLRVNRTRVRVALEWLRANNPLYRDIVISTDRLNALPSNGVPLEISDVARRTEDINTLIEESASYVPDDIPDDDGDHSPAQCFVSY